MTACNIACERAPAPFVTATKGERSKVASYSEKRRSSEREEKRREGGGGVGEGGNKDGGRDERDERGMLKKGRCSADENSGKSK